MSFIAGAITGAILSATAMGVVYTVIFFAALRRSKEQAIREYEADKARFGK